MNVAFDQLMVEFAIPTSKGFVIYEFATGMLIHEGLFPGGGANCLSILSNSNIVAASGDNSRDGFSNKTIVLWDRNDNKVIGLFEVQFPVTQLTLRSDTVIVANGDCISFHDCFDFHEKLVVKNPIPDTFSYAYVLSNSISLTALPASDGKSISIIDYHEPDYVFGSIPIAASKISFISFDRRGELMAVVLDDGKNIQLWSVSELKLVASYRRGMRSCEVTGIAFDSLSSFFVMITRRGTMHAFAIPIPSERATIDPKSPMRSQFSFDMPKNEDFNIEFDLAGYSMTCVTPKGDFKRVVLNIEERGINVIADKKLDM